MILRVCAIDLFKARIDLFKAGQPKLCWRKAHPQDPRKSSPMILGVGIGLGFGLGVGDGVAIAVSQ
jgi:hypothetical protein